MKLFRCGLWLVVAFSVTLCAPFSPAKITAAAPNDEAAKPEGEAGVEAGEGAGAEEKEIDFKKLKSPVPYTKKSIELGKVLYERLCVECHGPDGKSQIDVIADATDLTEPEYYYSGWTEGEVFRSIRDGAGENMPPYKDEVRDEKDLWHLVNFTRSLWPEKHRPELQADPDDPDSEASE